LGSFFCGEKPVFRERLLSFSLFVRRSVSLGFFLSGHEIGEDKNHARGASFSSPSLRVSLLSPGQIGRAARASPPFRVGGGNLGLINRGNCPGACLREQNLSFLRHAMKAGHSVTMVDDGDAARLIFHFPSSKEMQRGGAGQGPTNDRPSKGKLPFR